MKKSINILFAITVIIAGGLTSCKKSFLDLKPYNALPLADALTNEGNMNVAVNGMYAGLRDIRLYGRTLPIKGDLMADNTWIKQANSGRYLDFNDYNLIASSANPLDVWTAAYIVIKNANNIINSTLAGNTNINEFKGEAYAVRALMYFELVRNFAKPFTVDPDGMGVPLVTTFDQSNLPVRKSVKEIYTQILSDLTQATTLLTLNLGNSMTISGPGTVRSLNTSYFTKYSARALQAKVYMHMGDWANAKTAALDVVTNSGVTLVANASYVSYWKNPAPLITKVETLFEVTNDLGNNNGTNALAYLYDQSGYGDVLATTDLVSQYRTGDVRLQVINTGTNIYIVNKYSNTSNNADKDDIKVLRYADVVLILAEAYAKTADETNARLRLNQVAQNREPAFAGYASAGAQLVNDIINERRKELAFEGDRFFDLQRLNLAINKVRRENPLQVLPIAAGDFRRIFPIPQAETDVNGNLKTQQNPGY